MRLGTLTSQPADREQAVPTRVARGDRLGLARVGIPLALIVVAGAVRLWMIEYDAQNPFYDAAVRSMGLSWHNFFFGALTPEGSIAIDKPPVDLWLQVLSTKLLGFDRAALALPETLGGVAAVGLLYAAVTRAWGRLAGTLSGLALTFLPVAVLTSRSDTMDSLMSALLIAALWAAVIALQRRRLAFVILSAALVGLAFNVKLTQALIPVPAFAVMWWFAARRNRRIAWGAAAIGALIAVAMAWAFMASLTPREDRPTPMGSRGTGSIYRSMFLFNGLERLTGSSQGLTPIGFRSQPGPTRLLSAAHPGYASLVGIELVGALVLLAAWLVLRRRRAPSDAPPSNAGALLTGVAMLVWLATGYVLFSFMKRLEPRYLEAMSPAIAAVLGGAAASILRSLGSRLGRWLLAGALAANAAFAVYAIGIGDVGVMLCLAVSAATIGVFVTASLHRRAWSGSRRSLVVAMASLALLAAPADASIDLVEAHAGDANPGGGGGQYSRYLRAHQGKARYEAAATNPLAVVGLIASDGRPVLIMRSVDGVLVSVHRLEQLVKEGAVRYVIMAHPCSSGRHCTPTTAWSVRHAIEVRPGLYRYRR